MTDPVEFKSKAQIAEDEAKELVWVCTHCSCMTFTLRSNGDAICANCEHISAGPEDGAWFNRLLRVKTEIVPDSTISTVVMDYADDTLATRRFILSIDAKTAHCIIVVTIDGTVRTFGDDVDKLTDEQAEWQAKKLVEGMNVLMGGSSGD